MNPWVLVLRLTGLGWYVALCIVIGVVGGLWVDIEIALSIQFLRA